MAPAMKPSENFNWPAVSRTSAISASRVSPVATIMLVCGRPVTGATRSRNKAAAATRRALPIGHSEKASAISSPYAAASASPHGWMQISTRSSGR